MESSEAGSKRSRKPYTLTKARESWSNSEHERFIKALQLYNRDWKKIETYVGTKTVVQIRSHAQKYFQKIVKSGITDAIPPPRPKRRASDPPHGACHTDAKHARLQSEAPSRQGSGKDEDSDEGMQLHHSHAGHQAQHHPQQQHNSKQQHAELLEPSAQLETSRTLISCQGLQHVYLYLASLFSQPQADLAGMLQRLSTRDRHILAVLLKALVEELNHQQHTQPHALLSDQQHLHEDDQHHQHTGDHQDTQQPHQHMSGGSGGQSNGATVNTTAGTAAADAPEPAAAAAALPAPAAAGVEASSQPGQDAPVLVKHEPEFVGAAAAATAAAAGAAPQLEQGLPGQQQQLGAHPASGEHSFPQQQQQQQLQLSGMDLPVPQVPTSLGSTLLDSQQQQQQQQAASHAQGQQADMQAAVLEQRPQAAAAASAAADAGHTSTPSPAPAAETAATPHPQPAQQLEAEKQQQQQQQGEPMAEG